MQLPDRSPEKAWSVYPRYFPVNAEAVGKTFNELRDTSRHILLEEERNITAEQPGIWNVVKGVAYAVDKFHPFDFESFINGGLTMSRIFRNNGSRQPGTELPDLNVVNIPTHHRQQITWRKQYRKNYALWTQDYEQQYRLMVLEEEELGKGIETIAEIYKVTPEFRYGVVTIYRAEEKAFSYSRQEVSITGRKRLIEGWVYDPSTAQWFRSE